MQAAGTKMSKGLAVVLLVVLLALSSAVGFCEARSGRHHSHRQYGKGHQSPAMPAPPSPGGGNGYASPSPPPPSLPPQAPSVTPSPPPPLPPSLPPPEQPSQGAVFSVVNFGARGDGVTDDTQAFEAAWAAACKVEASTVLVPPELEFVVGPISFSGPNCKPNIIFQLDGTISAQTGARAWGSGLLQWLEFTKLNGISIQGSGVINGQGKEWWTYSDSNDDDDDMDSYTDKELEKMPQIKPTALRFYGSTNVRVTGISIVNSPQCHLKFDSCQGVMVHNLTISSPETSPNTDGIHLQNSKDVNIHHTDLACGDDCISIQTGCSDVNIHNVNCGPGHGISIGGLGRYNTKACVSNINVSKHTGLPMQGGSGLVQGIRFSNIHMSEVQTPIMIDQFYFTIKPAHFACSDSSPCSEITLTGIQLRPLIVPQYHMCSSPFCWQAFGELYTPTIPPISCLQLGKPAGNRVLSDHDQC